MVSHMTPNQLAYPTHFHISSGAGRSKHAMVAFDNALIQAKISNYNLLRVSSILPINCKQEDNISIPFGSLLPTAYATISSSEPNAHIAAAVAVGIPIHDTDIGVIMEYSAHCTAQEAEETVRSMVKEAMKNHSIPFKTILSSSVDGTVSKGEHLSLISAITMW